MKKIIALLLALCLCFSLFCGCAPKEDEVKARELLTLEQVTASAEDIAALEALYEGKTVAYGDTHGHSASSEWSDGKVDFNGWKNQMNIFAIDFATIVDHRQTIHMNRDDWDDTVFIGGSEPGLEVLDTETKLHNNLDYSMMFTDVEGLEAVLKAYPDDYKYDETTGRYESVLKGDRAKIQEIIQCIKDNGGLFVYVHPFLDGAYYDPVDRMNHWFADETGFEIYNQIAESHHPMYNDQAYECWVELLNAGKRIWATRGSDAHSSLPVPESLCTVYSAERNAEGYFGQIKNGNLTAGPVGIRIAVGDTVTGSTTSFEGKRVTVAVGDFHSFIASEAGYRVDIYDDQGLVYTQNISTTEMNYFAFDAVASAKYYRANVVDLATEKIIAVGNPVFNG